LSKKYGYMHFDMFNGLDRAIKNCEIISKLSICPTAFRGKPEDILGAIQYGYEIGLKPMQSLQSIAAINGKPCIYGDGLLALCLAHPVCEYVHESFDEETLTATCLAKRKGRTEATQKFSKKDAEEAGLWGRQGPWRTYPRRMLQMRARGFALRDAFPDVLKGIISREEAQDYPCSKSSYQYETIEHVNPEPMIQETKHRLNFLIKQVNLSNERIQKLKSFANVDCLENISEQTALKAINKLEKELAESMKQEEHEKVFIVRNGCKKCNNKSLGDYFCECEIKTAGIEPGDDPCEASIENVAVDKEEGEGE